MPTAFRGVCYCGAYQSDWGEIGREMSMKFSPASPITESCTEAIPSSAQSVAAMDRTAPRAAASDVSQAMKASERTTFAVASVMEKSSTCVAAGTARSGLTGVPEMSACSASAGSCEASEALRICVRSTSSPFQPG